MNLLFRVLRATRCRSTHHKLALDALRHLRHADAARWRALFLQQHEPLLIGAKAPDDSFKDFRNHVLHVGQNGWGGACQAARLWYGRTVGSLRKNDWVNSAYAAGVLSHYYTDPWMPFHTGQSPRENDIHRATEWSVTCSYDSLLERLDESGYAAQVEEPCGDDWLEAMVTAGAERSHRHYQSLVERYDFAQGAKNPPAGLDDECRRFLSELLGDAIVGFARILDRALTEAAVEPPDVDLSLDTLFATLSVPIRWIAKKLADASERRLVEAMFAEWQANGRVEKTLPADDRAIRDLVAAEFPHPSAKRATPSPTASQTPPQTPATPIAADPTTTNGDVARQRTPADAASDATRFHLEPSDDVVDAPSIGPKTAQRLAPLGIRKVADLLAADPQRTANRLDVRHVDAKTVRDWQDQARLVCRIPGLRGHDAQILVACDYREPPRVAEADEDELTAAAIRFANSPDGQRTLRSSAPPDRAEVAGWIRRAAAARELRAA